MLFRVKFSRGRFERITTKTPRNERMIPKTLFAESVSLKNTDESIAMKITFVLMRTAEIDALV